MTFRSHSPASRSKRLHSAIVPTLSHSALGVAVCVSACPLVAPARASTLDYTALEVEVAATSFEPTFRQLVRGDSLFIEEDLFDPRPRTAVIIRGDDQDVPPRPFASGQYPETVNRSLPAFAAADVTGDGAYGAGVSGIHFAPAVWESAAGFVYATTNDGPAPASITTQFHIPRLEASLAGVRGLRAEATATGTVSLFSPLVNEFVLVEEFDIFEFGLGATVNDLGQRSFRYTPDLQTAIAALQLNDTVDFRQAGGFDIWSHTVPGFSISYIVPDVPPGWQVEFLIAGAAALFVDPLGAEQGGQALVGDPFAPFIGGGPVLAWTRDRTGPGPIVIGPPPDTGPSDPTPAPIPLPAAAWLLLAALAALGCLGWQRR